MAGSAIVTAAPSWQPQPGIGTGGVHRSRTGTQPARSHTCTGVAADAYVDTQCPHAAPVPAGIAMRYAFDLSPLYASVPSAW